jgi:hypothetical protein
MKFLQRGFRSSQHALRACFALSESFVSLICEWNTLREIFSIGHGSNILVQNTYLKASGSNNFWGGFLNRFFFSWSSGCILRLKHHLVSLNHRYLIYTR